MTICRMFLSFLVIFCALSNPSLAASTSKDLDAKALKEISTFAENFCSVPVEGRAKTFQASGGAEVGLKKLISKLVDLNLKGASKYTSTEWSGPLQNDLSKLYGKKLDCKTEVLRILKDRLIAKTNLNKKTNIGANDSKKPLLNSSSVVVGDVLNNNNTQLNINSPNSVQLINQARVISRKAIILKDKKDDTYITQIILKQTSGIWDQGRVFKFGVKLSGPYTDWQFVKGIPGAKTNVVMNTDKQNGIIYFQTDTAPYVGEIIVVIRSITDLIIQDMIVSPSEND